MDDSPSRAVILAVADAERVDPTDLPPISEAIDPDALDRLVSRDVGHVRFDYHGYTVTVDRRGVVDIEPTDGDPSQRQRPIDAQHVMESAREGMSLVRPDGTFAFVNSAFAELFQYERHELLGERWTVLYHNQQAKRLEEDILPAVRATGYWSGETVRLTKHGEPRITDHRLALTDEDVILCTATDVTLDRTATRSDARNFDALVDEMVDAAFFTLDHEGYITRWNEAAERKGYEPTAMLGTHVSTLFPREERERGLPEQLLEHATRNGTVTEEGRLVRNDGTQFRADLTIMASYDDAGTIRGFGTVIGEPSESTASS